MKNIDLIFSTQNNQLLKTSMKTNVATEDTDKVFCYLSNVLHSALFMKLLRVISKNNHNKKKKNLVSSKTTLKEQFKKIF